ncbi:U3 snoRNP protein -like protein [Reticulomyxa filosa]|uniref:U3 snoRNP protein-like protein n=1 Tax=Reticulomyxa filosa TaxID=46433 RepID=X6MET6_RETFI|nr:U3 snoRNP protein -like protein [Reticulomyxa filosa]|eukprot:ETO12374.1 U3 snoRNP protein -like protein [Reticulomyxa filosa]
MFVSFFSYAFLLLNLFKFGGGEVQTEIRHVLKQRTYYAQNKFKFSKQDFLRYLQYETKLFGLLTLRAQKKQTTTWNDMKRIRSTFIRRIDGVYDLALSKHGKDRQLWHLSFEFSKKYSNPISRRKFLKALLLHPHWSDVWAEAALYEWEWNQNPTNARLLFQKGVQLNRQSPKLYWEFFKMEIAIIKKHFLLLSDAPVDSQPSQDDSAQNFTIDKDEVDWQQELKKMKRKKQKEETKQLEKLMTDMYSELQIPKLIFRYALGNTFENNRYELIKQMFLVLPQSIEEMELPSTADKGRSEALFAKFIELQTYMFTHLETQYSDDPVVVGLLANKSIVTNEQKIGPSKALEVYFFKYTYKYMHIYISPFLSGISVFEKALLHLTHERKINTEEKILSNGKEKTLEELIVDLMTHYVNYLDRRMHVYTDLKDKTWSNESNDKNEANDSVTMHDTTQQDSVKQIYDEVMDYLIDLQLRLLNQFKQYKGAKYMDVMLYQKWVHLLLKSFNSLHYICYCFFFLISKKKKGGGKHPSSAQLWKLYSQIYQRRLVCVMTENPNYDLDVEAEPNENNSNCTQLLHSLFKNSLAACQQGLKQVEHRDHPILWEQMIEIMMSQMIHSNERKDNKSKYWLTTLNKLFQSSILQCLSAEKLKLDYLYWANTIYSNSCDEKKKDKTHILKILSWFQNEISNCSPRVYYEIIQIYERLLFKDFNPNNDKHNVLLLKSVFEKAVNEHGKKSPAIWIWYVNFARKYMGLADGSQVYQKAMRTLDSEMLQQFYKKVSF